MGIAAMPVASGASGLTGVVVRPELVARLERGLEGGVILVSGPAGSGKTVLARSWLHASGRRVAWVPVARGEPDAQHFWGSVVEAVRAAAGPDSVAPLAATPNFDGDALVDRLRSELESMGQHVVLVIDDVHELSSTDALRQLERLFEEPLGGVSVVLVARGAPRLRLHRLRLAERLTELRAADLAFTPEQTGQVLAVSGIELSESGVVALHGRTEGWAAGVRLAALSLRGHPDPERFVVEFSGNDRTVAEYLFNEVLHAQPDDVRRMLLATSVLERVSAPLADALTGVPGSEAILRSLEESGSFVVALDSGYSWFRYHQLLVDLLRLELRRSAPEEVSRLHGLAAGWFAANGYIVEAIGHAQAAGDWQQAVGLLSAHYFSLTLDGRQATARGLLQSFPRDAMSADPELALMLAADELAQGSLDTSAAELALAMRHVEMVPPERRRRFEVGLALVRLSLARRQGDFESVLDLIPAFDRIEQPETWLDISMHNDLRAWALMNLGIVEAWSGRSAEGAEHLQQARELSRQIGRPYLEVGCVAHWASTVTRESFVRAQGACREAIQLAEKHRWGGDPVIAPALVTLASALAQTGRFDEAERWLDRADRILRTEVEPAVGCLLWGVRGALHLARGGFDEAASSFTRAADLGTLMVRPARLTATFRSHALLARLAAGQVEAVRAAIANMTDEERHTGEAREVIAEFAMLEEDLDAAQETLAPILDGSAPVHHVNVVVRALVRDAVIGARLGEVREAERAIERALDLAEPDRLVIPFAHTPSRELLERHPRHRTAHGAFLGEILDVLSGAQLTPVPWDPKPLLDPLTEVELRVLRFLPSSLNAREIGGELFLTENTVKTHMRHIYLKLDAHSRAQALERARAVGLVGPSGVRG